MAQVRHVDGLLRPGAQRSVARPPAGGAGAEHVTELLHDELAAHLRAAYRAWTGVTGCAARDSNPEPLP
jgi:hypothetical protein